MRHPDYFQVLVALDQLVNTFFGGYADETVSSRIYRASQRGKRQWLEKLVNCLFFWQNNHCKEAYESEINRSQQPPEIREKINVQ